MSIELVDQGLCNGCGLCVITCPLDVIRLDTVVAERGENPPCRQACPAGVDIRTYISLLKDGLVSEALEVLRESLPLPAVTGRVCPHPCEAQCARAEVDEAVNINSLERFVADEWLKQKAVPVLVTQAGKVAVIGSGPAGLSCAYFLCRMGYSVTVFEAMPVLGGMLRTGIPAYRLPRDVLDAQIDYIGQMGVDFQTGVTVGKDVTLDKLQKEYAAVFYAAGNRLCQKIDLDGSDLDGVLWGLEFLESVNLGESSEIKGRVVVIGGGNVAVDVALSALRLGAESVDMVCLEQADQMPAFEEELAHAVEEGVTIRDSWGPKRILGDGGKVSGVKLIRCTCVFDKRGQFCPTYEESVDETMEADTVILAVGQAADLSLVPKGVELADGGRVQVDPVTLETTVPGVFAGGDIVSGPASVVEAIGAGKTAAVSIGRHLRKEDLRSGRCSVAKSVAKPPKEGMDAAPRNSAGVLSVGKRACNFKETKRGFDVDTADLEAQRCMTCGSRAVISYVDDCMLCLHCEHYCPQKAIHVSPEKKVLPLIPWG